MEVGVNGTRLFFDVDGAKLVPAGEKMRERPTLVVVHGGPGSDHSDFKPFLSPLAQVSQLVYLDLRGQGRSAPATPETWNLREWSRDLREFCDALGIVGPIVLGASFGSLVALQYAIEYPAHPSKLILLEAAPRFDYERIFEAMGRFGGPAHREAAERFFTDPSEANHLRYREICAPLYTSSETHSAESPVIDRPEVGRHFFGGEAKEVDLRSGASRLECPVLVANGTCDPITTIASGRELVDSMPEHLARFVAIEGASHDLALDAPGQVRGLVEDFLLDLDGRR